MLGRNGKSTSRWLKTGLKLAVVGGVLVLSPVTLGNDISGDIASAVTPHTPRENSVLVASRKGEPTPADPRPEGGDEQLDPITFDLENEPQPADPNEALDPQVGQEQVIRVASSRSDCPEAEPAVSEPQLAMFHGIQPGVSTRKHLIETWGSPKEATPTPGGELLAYEIESFRGVQVLVEDGVVTLMKIQLGKPETPDALAAKVKASPSEVARVYDDTTRAEVGVIYPERGIVFVYDTSDDEIGPEAEPQVSLMLLQPLDPQAFCMRGEQRPIHDLSGRLADFTEAVTVAPADAEANWMLAELQLQVGRATEAAASAKRALDAEPENPAYRLRWAECLVATGQYDTAVLETRQVIDTPEVPSLVQAQAYHQLGLLASLGDAEIADTAIEFHNLALTAADKLATHNDPYVRRQAKQILVDSHLAIAVEVSRHDYIDKPANVADWVSRASGFAEEMIASGEAGLEVRLHVAERSLAALANFKPAKDPQPLLDEVEQTLEELLQGHEEIDPLWRECLHWNTGLAYLSAVQINHQRGATEEALEYADRGVEYLADAAEQRRDSPATQQLVGRLYFHLGAVHAVHNKDHSAAVMWYDKSIPLLAVKEEPSELVVPRYEGEALVSMAVSFWSEGEKQRAVDLTEAGAALIESGVEAGVLQRKTLAVPYGNLATMHKLLGHAEEAERFAQLASAAARSQPTATQVSTPIRRLQPPASQGSRSSPATQKKVSPSTKASPQSASRTRSPSGTRPLSGQSSRGDIR